jgi:NAD(P)-dependent dehydrogenase (short-subunit alcohol dehydrogenase family)
MSFSLGTAFQEENPMDLDLTGRTALVAAAPSGIGLATARGLARQGAALRINGRDQARLDAARASILEEAPGAKVDTVVADVATAAGCAKVIKTVTGLDILIPMAGGTNNLRPAKRGSSQVPMSLTTGR